MPHAPNTAVHVTLRTWPKVVRQQPKVVRQQPKVVYRGILGAEKVRPVSGLIQYVYFGKTNPLHFDKLVLHWSKWPEGFRAQDHLELEGDFGSSLRLAL